MLFRSARAPGDSALLKFWPDISQEQTFISDPAGAMVARAALDDTLHWIPIGTTPTEKVRIPNNAWLYRYTKPGYRTVTIMGARLGGSYVPIPDPVPMRRLTEPDTDMVLIAGGNIGGTMFGIDATHKFNLSNFLMDRLEVTNRQYKAFVAAGGYAKPQYWDSTIADDGRDRRAHV